MASAERNCCMQLLVTTPSHPLDSSFTALQRVQDIQRCFGLVVLMLLFCSFLERERVTKTNEPFLFLFSFLCHHLHFCYRSEAFFFFEFSLLSCVYILSLFVISFFPYKRGKSYYCYSNLLPALKRGGQSMFSLPLWLCGV